MAVLIVEDLVSRKWLSTVVSVEETSTQVEIGFTDALEREGLLEVVEARHADGRVDLRVDDQSRPILLAVSDNGPQMTSGSTREFMALCAIAQHFGRPGTPTDQAWISTAISRASTHTCSRSATRPPCAPSWRPPARITTGSGFTRASAMSAPTTSTTDAVTPSARPAKPGSKPHAAAGLPGTASTGTINPPRNPTMLADQTRKCVTKSETRQISPVVRPLA
jgi:hypothetical protein